MNSEPGSNKQSRLSTEDAKNIVRLGTLVRMGSLRGAEIARSHAESVSPANPSDCHLKAMKGD